MPETETQVMQVIPTILWTKLTKNLRSLKFQAGINAVGILKPHSLLHFSMNLRRGQSNGVSTLI